MCAGLLWTPCILGSNEVYEACTVRGVTTGGEIPPAPGHYGGAEKSQQFQTQFLQYSNFLAKDLRFEHGGAKLASCPGRHLTSLRPCAQ